MRILKPQQLTRSQALPVTFVTYEDCCKVTVYIGKSDQGYTAIHCVDSELSNVYYVYDTLQELIHDYYVNMLYMINYCHDATARQILDSLRDERLAARLAAQE